MKPSTSLDSSEQPQALKGRKKNLGILFLVTLLDLIGFGMILPLIPYLGRATESSPVMVGLLMSIYSIMQFLFSPFWGGFSDRFGRKPILLISILGASVSHTAFALLKAIGPYFSHDCLQGFLAPTFQLRWLQRLICLLKKTEHKPWGLLEQPLV